jgi:hypothetical protein
MKTRWHRVWILGVEVASARGLATGPTARAQGKKAVRSPPPLAADAPSEFQQGSVHLEKCDALPGYCGRIVREMDPAVAWRCREIKERARSYKWWRRRQPEMCWPDGG